MVKTQTVPKRAPQTWTCPVCARPFTALDLVMFEHEENYQCRYCWNQVKKGGSGESPFHNTVRRVKLSRS